jgi:hypothetical protein
MADSAEGRPAGPEADVFGLDRMPPDAPFDLVETPMGPRIGL